MLRLLWLPLNLIQLALIVAWTTGLILLAIALLLFTRRPDLPLHMARRIWAPGILHIIFTRLTVSCEIPIDFARPHFFVSNHQSALDIPVLFLGLPTPLRFVAKVELFRLPVLGWYMRATGMLPVDRKHKARSARKLAEAGSQLPSGGSVLAFPEGTRSHGGPIRDFHRGPFLVALQLGLPVVPVAVEGTAKVLHRSGVSAVPGRVQLRLGRPIEIAGMGLDQRAELARSVEAEVRRLHAELVAQPRK